MEKLRAILFDMDGTIVDTEKDGHRVAFNMAFAQHGLKAEWDVDLYHNLLQISGGKERMKFWFENSGKEWLPPEIPIDGFIQQLHQLKTTIFISLIENGKLPLRPGIKRIMQEANESGILVGICSTSNEKSVNTIANTLLEGIKIDLILAGDVVTRKKPDPEIYLLALQKTGLAAEEVIVVEDSENGLISAKEAGIKVLVTVNEYTKNENLDRADAVVSSLGDEKEMAVLLAGNLTIRDNMLLHISDLINL
jgi:HAD superfamily hydrolase (TIGR01509 family)